ncbi:MAG: ABC transporter ATP-binding protein [Aminivibrio sp.]|jgi:putative hydroxymethylpyrimidine transport system ATP-binding protein|nr:ABC transporter ATP-binding protein [Aminivibrio sp.]
MLEIRSFSKSFDSRPVFSDFSLSAEQGSFTVLLGPSGCGKSTLFDLLMGILPRDSGRISLGGREMPDLRGAAAYMSQKDLLLPWKTLRENALLPVAVKRTPAAEDHRRAEDLFSLLGLSGREDYFPGQVSGGMAQRCALARTILFDTPVALLDEPLSALDAITRRTLRGLLLLLQSRFGKTILMVTHDVEEALLLADTILLLSPPPMRILEVLRPEGTKDSREESPSFAGMKRCILKLLQEGSR